MTIGGAISDLNNLLKAEDIPIYYKPSIKKVIETIEQLSTTKNDLEVRRFEEIVVGYPPEDLCTYPEYKGKPYFSIKYKEGNDYIIGYGTYNLKVFSRYLRDYFMSSVTPQETKTGRWITLKDEYGDIHEAVCSCCDSNGNHKWNYCPNCGAKMVEPQESEEQTDDKDKI